MIARIEGQLEQLETGCALVNIGGGLTYQVLVSSYTAGRLGGSIGKAVTLHTLHYFESLNQGASLIPRLAGFLRVEDRRFFELFTTCKGIGQRKALRALTLDIGQIASAIADRDVAMLQSLPEIGKRTAETIIATLHGKVDHFLTTPTFSTDSAPSAPGAGSVPYSLSYEALEVLTQLGENRSQALQWVDRALRDDNRPGDVQQLIARVYQIKAGA